MKGDFTRDSFDRRRLFTRVMMQQGRVQLDADWNEQTSLTLDYIRTLARDLLGGGAGPEGHCGFRIATSTTGTAGLTDLEKKALEAADKALKKGDLLFLPGRYYVGGILIDLAEPTLYTSQAGYPFDETTTVEVLKGSESWVAYLDVWEDFICADQDETIRELALGGVDTCGRALMRWQVRILPNPRNGIQDLDDIAARQPGRLSAKTKPGEAPNSPCIIPPDARYRGLENQLYRVEIHEGSDENGAGATFKWSRDNGSLTFPVEDVDNDNLVRLGRLGRDEKSGLTEGNWVELLDDSLVGRNPAGPLAEVAEVHDDRSVLLKWADPSPNLPGRAELLDGLRPVLRRWDHKGQVKENRGAIKVEASVEFELEDGIFVQFEETGPFRAGDYWLIPARVVTNEILWSDFPQRKPPDGPKHYYAPLAMFKKVPRK